MFFGGDQVVQFRPKGPEDVEAARQASDYMNHVFMHQEEGFRVGYDWMKTALIEKNSVVKAYYEEIDYPEILEFEQITETALEVILSEDNTEIIGEIMPREDVLLTADPQTGEMVESPTFDVTVRRIITKKRIRVVAIPPEEFLISRGDIHLDDDTSFSCHRVKKTISDLITMGLDPDTCLALSGDESAEFEIERTERHTDDEVWPGGTGERADAVSREVWVNDTWTRVDVDGDGYLELRHILAAGDSSLDILINEYASHNPFSDIVPIPMPHKWFGLSVADTVKDLQLIRSTILRQVLDNMYVLNNGRWEVVEGAVEIDDLLSSLPGGVVRVTAPGMVRALDTPALPAELLRAVGVPGGRQGAAHGHHPLQPGHRRELAQQDGFRHRRDHGGRQPAHRAHREDLRRNRLQAALQDPAEADGREPGEGPGRQAPWRMGRSRSRQLGSRLGHGHSRWASARARPSSGYRHWASSRNSRRGSRRPAWLA